VISVFFVDQGLYFLMTLQAFLVRYFVPKIMAQRAIAHPFKICMRLRQVTGGNLTITHGETKNKKVNGMFKTVVQSIYL